jgi:hypothetical protein
MSVLLGPLPSSPHGSTDVRVCGELPKHRLHGAVQGLGLFGRQLNYLISMFGFHSGFVFLFVG